MISFLSQTLRDQHLLVALGGILKGRKNVGVGTAFNTIDEG